MICQYCQTYYTVSPNQKGTGCPNIRNHPTQIKIRMKKFLKQGYNLHVLRFKIRFNKLNNELLDQLIIRKGNTKSWFKEKELEQFETQN